MSNAADAALFPQLDVRVVVERSGLLGGIDGGLDRVGILRGDRLCAGLELLRRIAGRGARVAVPVRPARARVAQTDVRSASTAAARAACKHDPADDRHAPHQQQR